MVFTVYNLSMFQLVLLMSEFLSGHTEPIHCVRFYKNQIVSATTSNKIGVHTSVDAQVTINMIY